MKAKRWQIALVVVGFLVAAVALGYQFFHEDVPALNTKFYLLNPSTGDLYFADWDKVRFTLPAADPETGEHHLIRVTKESGKWEVLHRDLPLVKSISGAEEMVETDGTLKREPKSPVPYRPKPAT